MKLRIKFKNSDLISEYIRSVVPDDETLNSEREAEKLADKFFKFCDYGAVEIDTDDGTGRLVPIKEWSRW